MGEGSAIPKGGSGRKVGLFIETLYQFCQPFVVVVFAVVVIIVVVVVVHLSLRVG